jgi:hypothetical protein
MNSPEFKCRRTPSAIAAGLEVARVVVTHDAFTRALKRSMDLVETLSALRMPGGILIQAESGMGKTLLLKLIEQQVEANAPSGRVGRCLYLKMDSGVDNPKLGRKLARALGYPAFPTRVNSEAVDGMIETGLERAKPAAFLIDEFQHVCTGKRDITANHIADWFKVRLDATKIPFVGVGTMLLERMESINDQFTGRVSASNTIPLFTFGEDWRRVLAAYCQQVMKVDMSILNGPVAQPLHEASKGNMRALKKILIFGAMHAASRSDAKLKLEDLAQGYADVMEKAGRANPLLP